MSFCFNSHILPLPFLGNGTSGYMVVFSSLWYFWACHRWCSTKFIWVVIEGEKNCLFKTLFSRYIYLTSYSITNKYFFSNRYTQNQYVQYWTHYISSETWSFSYCPQYIYSLSQVRNLEFIHGNLTLPYLFKSNKWRSCIDSPS